MEQIEILKKALTKSGISISEEMVGQFSKYQRHLVSWNQKINLISRKDEGRIVTKHFLESLGLVKVIRFPVGTRILDLGTGAGFPGVPLKIIRPDIHLILVESKKRKVHFLKSLIDHLHLKSIEVVQGRIEEIGKSLNPVQFIVSRAVTDLISLVKWSKDCIHPKEGILVVIKGPAVKEELDQLSKVSSDLGITGWQLERYDPFPSTLQLKDTYIVAVQRQVPPKPQLINQG